MGRPHLTDDERLRVRVLRNDANFTFARISQITGYGERQIRNALKSPTVGKRSGRPTALSPAQEAELVRFVTASKENRSMTYADIGKALFDGAHGEYAIRNTLRRLGFKRSGPVLKQVTRENEQARGGCGPAGGAVQGEGAAVAEGTPAGEGFMGGVTGTEPGVTREPDPAANHQMITEDEGHAQGQARANNEIHTEGQPRGEEQAPAEAPAETQVPAEERVATLVAAPVNETRPEDVAGRPQETARAEEGSRKTGDPDSESC